MRAGDDAGRDPRVVEVVQGLVGDADVAAAGAGLELVDALEQLAVGGEEAVARLPVALDQRAADEQRARQLGVDPAVRDRAPGDDRQPVERHALRRDDGRALAVPARLVVGAADEVVRQRLDRARVDPRGDPAPEPRRLDELGDHHPRRRSLRERRARPEREARAARALELAPGGVLEPELGEQPREQRGVDRLRLRLGAVERHVDLLGRLAELGDEVLPLAHAQVVEELGVAATAELVARQRALLLAQVAPQVQEREEVGMLVGEAGVELIGLLALLGRALARVLDRQRGGDDDDLLRAAEPVGLEDHPAEPRVDGQLGEPAAERRELLALVERGELLQQADPVADLTPVGRVQEREVGDVAELRRRHLEQHAGQVGAEDLRVGEARALLEVLLVVEPDADPVGDPAAAALALVGRRLRDRLDRQPLDLQPRAVAADPGGAGVDHVADPRHGQRRLRDVRRQHDPARAARLEHAVLLAVRQPRVEREDLHVRPQPALQGLRGVADLALAGEEDEHVAGRLAQQLLDGVADRVGLVAVPHGPVPHRDRVGAAGDLDDRRVAEVRGEALRVDRRRGDDQLQVGPAREDPREVAEQEVDVEAALVRLVDDHRVVAAQQPVLADLREQEAVGHDPDQRVGAAAVAEADGVPDRLAERDAELLRDPLRDGARGEPARLGVGDRAGDPAAELEADLRQLGRLAAAGLPRDDDDLVVADRGGDLVLALADRELRRIGDRRDRGAAALAARLGGGGHGPQRYGR